MLKILKFPNEELRTKAKPVNNINTDIKRLVKDMFNIMYDNDGVGLAATQVGKHLRIFVVDISKDLNQPLCFINPQITTTEGEYTDEEGCLSVPEFTAQIKRFKTVTVTALDQQGKEFRLEATGLLAKCIQHETDHLNGILFIDYLSKLKQKRLLDKINKGKL